MFLGMVGEMHNVVVVPCFKVTKLCGMLASWFLFIYLFFPKYAAEEQRCFCLQIPVASQQSFEAVGTARASSAGTEVLVPAAWPDLSSSPLDFPSPPNPPLGCIDEWIAVLCTPTAGR